MATRTALKGEHGAAARLFARLALGRVGCGNEESWVHIWVQACQH